MYHRPIAIDDGPVRVRQNRSPRTSIPATAYLYLSRCAAMTPSSYPPPEICTHRNQIGSAVRASASLKIPSFVGRLRSRVWVSPGFQIFSGGRGDLRGVAYILGVISWTDVAQQQPTTTRVLFSVVYVSLIV